MKKILMILALAVSAFAQSSVTLTAVAPPPVQGFGGAVVGTAGTTLACYWVVTNYVGGAVLSAAPVCLTNVPNTLSSMNYVQLSWQAAAGLNVTYDVLKTTTSTPPVAGASSSLTTLTTATTYNDIGGGLSAYTIAAFPYATQSVLVRLNNRDYVYPAFECIAATGQTCEDAQNFIIPKQSNTTVRLGSRTTPLTIDNTGALYITQGSATPGAPVGTITASGLFSVAVNVTLAQVNAGFTFLPAVATQTYKVHHALIQAIGADTAACTLLEIADTAGTPIVAMSAAIAAATQNTRVTEATAAASVTTTTFAPTALTAGKGLQILKTGSSCTGPTSFNVIVFFSINS